MNRAESRRLFARTLWRDLADPFPGRLAQAWRIALVCALATMMSAVYTTPAAAIGCFLVFFVMKPDAAEGSVMAVALVVLVSLVLVLLVFLTRWTIDVPAWRFLVLISISLVLLYLGSASLLGELGGIITLVVFFVLTLLSDVPVGEVATRGILYAGLMAATPMACVLVVNLTMGIKPLRLLRQTLDQRLLMCAEWFEHSTPQSRAALSEHVWEGQEIALKRMGLTRLFALGRKAELRRLARALRESYRLSMLALTLPNELAQSTRHEISAAIRRAAQALSRGEVVQDPGPMPVDMPDVVKPIWVALQNLSGTPKQYPVDGPSDSFFRADAKTNPEHVRYAIKTTVAAMICYLTYTAVQWQGIHTAMITCYVAALGSVAETTHKMVLRITGCLIGAALGIGSILFIMPYITSVGAIMVLVFVVTFIAAWVWVGNERVSYAGVQVALAFLLTVLQGSGPTLDMGTARDRIVGVLLGNVVLYLVFTRLWPISAVRRAWESLQQTMLHLAAMGRISNDKPAAPDLRISYASKIAALLADYRRVTGLIYFEPARQRPSNVEVNRTTKIASALRVITLQWVRHPEVNDASVQQMTSLATECSMTEGAGAEASRKWGEPQVKDDRVNAQDRELRTLRGLIDGR